MVPSLPSILLRASSSPSGKVGKATSRALIGPDWMSNMDICNSANSNPWQAKAFVKAVKKRLQNKNSKVQFLALMLLEEMTKNCGDFVHFQVVDVGILQEMIRIVRNTKNMQVRERILLLLEYWQEAFGGSDGKYPQYYYTFAELKRSGVRFPQIRREENDPTPVSIDPAADMPQIGHGMPSNSIEKFDEVMGYEKHDFSSSDLDDIQSAMDLFNNMLQNVSLKDYVAIKDEVIIDLVDQCHVSQKKLMHLINSTENDDLLRQALAMNESLQTLLSKYDALVYESSLPPGTSEASSFDAKTQQSDNKDENEGDEEDDDDGFSILAKRNSALKSTKIQESSPSENVVSTEIPITTAAEEEESNPSNALIVFDPTAAFDDSSKKEGQDMIQLISLTQTNPNPFSDYNYLQSNISNKEYATYNSSAGPLVRPDSLSSNPFMSPTYAWTQSLASQPGAAYGSKETRLSADLKLAGPSCAPKIYMPDNLFEDLIKLRNPDGSLKSRDASSLWGFKREGMTSVN